MSARSRRIEVRVSDEERRLEEAEAAALGLSLSEFIRRAASGRAHEVLQERTTVTLGNEEARRFLAALDDGLQLMASVVMLRAASAGD